MGRKRDSREAVLVQGAWVQAARACHGGFRH